MKHHIRLLVCSVRLSEREEEREREREREREIPKDCLLNVLQKKHVLSHFFNLRKKLFIYKTPYKRRTLFKLVPIGNILFVFLLFA